MPLMLAGRISEDTFWKVFIWLSRCLVWNLRVTGRIAISIDRQGVVPQDRPLIIAVNHQSMFDIPLLITVFWPRKVRFVAKKELSRGVPSVSLGLRLMRAALIDRKDRVQALQALTSFATSIKTERGTACVFPEGTRAKDGIMKPFRPAGLATLINTVPEAVIVPVAISGSWFVVRHKLWPVEVGSQITVTILPPVEPAGISARDLAVSLEAAIRPLVADPRAIPAPPNSVGSSEQTAET